MTQGPATSTSGYGSPIENSPTETGVTRELYRCSADLTDVTHLADQADLAMLGLVLLGGADERREQRMRPRRLRLELGMELDGEIPGMAGHLGDLDELPVRRTSRDTEAVLAQCFLVQAVELVAMAMTLANRVGAVHALRK